MPSLHKKIGNTQLKLEGELEGVGPVQGWGTVGGRQFYFRARWDEWSFAISEYAEIDPVDIQLPEQGKRYGYLREGTYGKPGEYAASYMNLDLVQQLIEECCREYLDQKNVG